MNKDIKKTKQIIKALNHELYNCGDAYHELWNTWICALSPYEMVESAYKFNFTILGYFKLDQPKLGLDIGVVAENNYNGERFWCHAKKAWFEDWKEDYPELYEEE